NRKSSSSFSIFFVCRPEKKGIGNASVTAVGRARLSSGRHNRNQTARSVWSAWSLLPLSNRATHPTAGASSTHSIRFARHDRPCHPSVQSAPYPPKSCAKKQDFRLYYSARRRIFGIVARRAEDRRALPAVTDRLRGLAYSGPGATNFSTYLPRRSF